MKLSMRKEADEAITLLYGIAFTIVGPSDSVAALAMAAVEEAEAYGASIVRHDHEYIERGSYLGVIVDVPSEENQKDVVGALQELFSDTGQLMEIELSWGSEGWTEYGEQVFTDLSGSWSSSDEMYLEPSRLRLE